MPLHTRPPLARMQRIVARIREGDTPNCRTLATELEVTPKTVQRDLDYLRERLGLPIAYDAQAHGYYLTGEIRDSPALQVTEGELVALLVARDVVAQYRGTPYERQIETAFDKLLLPLQEAAGSLPAHTLVSFKIAAPAAHELELFNRLVAALNDQIEIAFDYRKLGAPDPAPRAAQPLHLAHRDGRWYLIAYDLGRQGMRTFALSRIQDLLLTGKTFERPKDFSAERYFASALAVRRGPETHRVRIRFDPLAADDIRDRFFHESQTFEPQPDGSLDLLLTLGDLLEIQRLILQWGGHATALEPPALRASLATAAAALHAAHRDALGVGGQESGVGEAM